jgi:hypothetical protein
MASDFLEHLKMLKPAPRRLRPLLLLAVLAAISVAALTSGSAAARPPRLFRPNLPAHRARGSSAPRLRISDILRKLASLERKAPRHKLPRLARPAINRSGRRARVVFRRDTAGGGGYPTSPGLLTYYINPSTYSGFCGSGVGVFQSGAANGAYIGLPGLALGCDQSYGISADYAVTQGLTPPIPYTGYFGWSAATPAGMTIDNVFGTMSVLDSQPVGYGGEGWFGESYSASGPLTSFSDTAGTDWGAETKSFSDTVEGPAWGFDMTCGLPPYCGGDTAMGSSNLEMNVTETARPSISTPGEGANIANEPARWVWNPAGDPWSFSTVATDPSGVCALTATLGAKQLVATAGSSTPQSRWLICDDASGSTPVDLNSWPTGSQVLSIEAMNGAFLTSTQQHTVYVDNAAVSVALSTPNDLNPTVWVDHPVTVVANTTAGPSGVAGTSCSIGNGAAAPYTGPLKVDGTGQITVSCTGQDNAVDPQGQPRTGTGSETIAIDETPPSIAFSPSPPGDPAEIVADTSDGQSGVEGGSMAIAPAGSSTFKNVRTSFTGSQLVADVDDAGLNGAYQLRATICDAAGNCTSTVEPLTMPLRTSVTSLVGFAKKIAPKTVVKRRVRVGWHWVTAKYHGKRIRVKVGGHRRTIKIVIGKDARCSHKQVRTGRHRWLQINACRRIRIKTITKHRERQGHAITIRGLLSSDGVALANRHVFLSTAPHRPGHRFHRLAIVTTNAQGTWSYRLPAGPSRIIHARFFGAQQILPSTGRAFVTVRAKIVLKLSPDVLPWAGAMQIAGHLAGGYVPHDGVALRFLAYYHGSKTPAQLFVLRTNRHGQFKTSWSYHSGEGVSAIRFAVASISKETDYPWAPSQSRGQTVTFGRATPAAELHPRHHHRHKVKVTRLS